MSFDLYHILASEELTPAKRTSNDETFFTVGIEGQFAVLYPGRVRKRANATFTYRIRVSGPEEEEEGRHPLHGGWQTANKTITLRLRIFDPDNAEFTADEVTLADLRKHRDLRGTPSGLWSYKLSGESEHFTLTEDENITNAKGVFELGLDETVPSESAPPLLPNTLLDGSRQAFKFDLFRVGAFIAELTQSTPADPWHGSMRLLDPDGTAVARTTSKKMRYEVDLAALGKSRDAAGHPRYWTLEVSPQGGVVVGSPRISATVIGSGRINTAVLHDRITRMIGPRGSFIRIFGENSSGEALGRLEITDPVAAETIDMHGLLDKPLSREQQDAGVDPKDVSANTIYTLYRTSEDLGSKTRLDVSTLKIRTIDVTVAPGDRLGGAIPAVKLKVKVTGKAKVKLGSATLADGKIRNREFEMEVGISVSPDGTPQVVCWVPDDPFDIDLHWGVVAAAGAIAGPLIALGASAFAEYLEHVLNEKFAEGARELFDDPALAPRILMTIFGAHLTYLPIRFEGDDIVFDYIAPLEPDPKPRDGYAGAIGRAFDELGPGVIRFRPPTLGNTWAADNLANIDHIVVVMMENRSYDHVLGYRAQGSPGDGADGLTSEVIAAIEAADGGVHKVRKLREAGFPPNVLGFMTRFPRGVGHDLDDVRQQLSGRAPGPGNSEINDPKGFVENFEPRVGTDPEGLVRDDVLGYYEAADLPFFAHLAEHYAYCDQYYCSHPGPTLPNRMYSLAGDVQHDRLGVPILDNNHGDNFLLSRALTIYDVLTKRGVRWRVYESNPSVTMLRMFARYATNDTEIVPIARLEADVANGDLPDFTVIEPAMHHHPQDDDHPDADMYRGQIFLKRVYDALRSNPTTWQKTLLIITYDEHGGLYDHVVPPVADLLRVSGSIGGVGEVGPVISDGESGGSSGESGTGGRGRLGGIAVDRDDITVATEHPEQPPPDEARPSLPIPYGVRVPTFVVSPWTIRGKGPSIILDHCSILKTVLAKFAGEDKPFLSDRVQASQSFDSYLTEAQPRMDVPPSPTLGELPINVRRLAPGASAIETPPLSRKRMREGPVDYHELTGRLARMLGR